jgi:hypothetical protein
MEIVLEYPREFPCDLLKALRLEYDLRPCVADDIAVDSPPFMTKHASPRLGETF